MTQRILDPDLRPDRSPIDLETCETAQLFNPPHMLRLASDEPHPDSADFWPAEPTAWPMFSRPAA